MNESLRFRTICLKNGIELSDVQQSLMEHYVELLLSWNAGINLISRKDEANVWESHILHCASLAIKFEFPKGAKVLDLGTGGGLPGIPLKILRPDLIFVLIDSTKKKIDAVSNMISKLGLTQIIATWGRIEEMSLLPELSKNFHFVVARAVAPLDDLVRWSRPVLSIDKKQSQTTEKPENKKILLYSPALVALKGGDLSREIELTKRKQPTLNISPVELVFEDSTYLQANDKKAVVVQF